MKTLQAWCNVLAFWSYFISDCVRIDHKAIWFYLFSDLFGKRFNVTHPTPRSTTRETFSTPWSRPVFSDHQRKTLEDRFQLQHYLNKGERYHLSLCLGLTEHQIKVWFQNRRVKWRQGQKANEQSTKLSPGAPSAKKHWLLLSDKEKTDTRFQER